MVKKNDQHKDVLRQTFHWELYICLCENHKAQINYKLTIVFVLTAEVLNRNKVQMSLDKDNRSRFLDMLDGKCEQRLRKEKSLDGKKD